MTDSLLRDKIVLGIQDSETRKRLLQERNLTLNMCMDICKSAEAAETHLKAFKDNSSSHSTSSASVHKVERTRAGGKQSSRGHQPHKYKARRHQTHHKQAAAKATDGSNSANIVAKSMHGIRSNVLRMVRLVTGVAFRTEPKTTHTQRG